MLYYIRKIIRAIVHVLAGRGEILPGKAMGLGEKALEYARGELGKGEDGGNNKGPDIRRYIKETGIGSEGGAWCALLMSYCLSRAAKDLGRELPFKLSTGAKSLGKNIAGAGMYVKFEELRPGDFVVYDRGDPTKPSERWWGHITVVDRVSGGLFWDINGNVGSYPAKVRILSHDYKRENRIEFFARAP